LNFTTSLTNKDVFNNVLFISLEAIYGGAIYTFADVSIKNCKFVNNSATSNQGNDIYVASNSNYLGQTGSVVSTCSVSLSPKIILTSGVIILFICYQYFCLLCIIIRLRMITCFHQRVAKVIHVHR
jgi:hypothetical protein